MKQSWLPSIPILLLLGASCPVAAQQFPHQRWYNGKIMLEDKSMLEGSIKYNMQTNTVECEIAGKFNIYTARQVIYFTIYDSLENRYRSMYTLPYPLYAASYRLPVFFELLQEGKITLLCREALEYQTYRFSPYAGGYTSYLTLVHQYFILNQNADVVSVVGKRAAWMALMVDRKDEVTQFITKNKLHFHTKSDISKIIAFYNSTYEK